MTNDYKENLLKYLVGKLPQETGDNIPIFKQTKTIEGTLKEKIKEELNANDVSIIGKIFNKDITNWLLYGFYYTGTDYIGFVCIIDQNINILKIINKFDSNENLFPIVAMQQDENNYFYCLTCDIGKNPQTTRVILLNNILGSGASDGNYLVKIRKSYITPEVYSLVPWNANKIIKAPGEAVYFIFTVFNSKTTIVRFTIDIEQGNSWDKFQTNNIFTTGTFDYVLQKLGENLEIYVYGIETITNSKLIGYSLIGDTLTKIKDITLDKLYDENLSKILVYNQNDIYVGLSDTTNKKSYLKKLVGNSFIQIKEYNGSTTPLLNPMINLEKINNVIFYMSMYYDDEIKMEVGIIQNDNLYNYLLNNIYVEYTDIYFFNDYLITNNYNLFNIYIPTTLGTIKSQLIYNQNNYNGLPFKNKESLLSNSGILSLNDDILFARNIYNRTVSQNMTTSSFEIPNTSLNDIEINKQQLISKNNNIMNDKSEIFKKNIYETMYINYANIINMINKNNPNNEIFNQDGSYRLNISANNINDYENSKATKYKINYVDGTSKIEIIQPSQIEMIATNKYKYNLTIYIDKKILNIQFISNDELTIYQEVDLKELNIMSTYNITQDVEVV